VKKEDFLVEIGTEELPPKALASLGLSFKASIEQGLEVHHLGFGVVDWFATPRRIAVLVHQLDQQAPDEEREIFGPPEAIAFGDDGTPSKAAQAFARKNGLSLEQLELGDTDKGKRLVHRQVAPGISASAALPSLVADALEQLPIPKRMRWGSLREEFVRPVHWLVMLLGEQVLTSEIMAIKAGRLSRGHRFHHPAPLAIPTPSEYAGILRDEGKVIANFEERRNAVRSQIEAKAREIGCTAIIDDDLLDEVTALVEWPVALAGEFEPRFLEVPAEALISSMKSHQKYFHVVNHAGKLQPHFIFLANLLSKDPQQIIEGNQKVIRPRLSDAAFFYETDLKITLESRRERLKDVVFQQQLGSLWDKSERVARLAKSIAGEIGGEPKLAERAAQIAKCDLVSEMVFEFDDLQGTAGYYYALHDGEAAEVAAAIKEQYLPRFAGDQLPTSLCGNALAIAERLDTLVGIFGIDQAPSGSKDPFALRRAALGIIRIIRENRYSTLDLHHLIGAAADAFASKLSNENVETDVSNFIFDRYRAIYQEEGVATNTVVAVQRVIQGNTESVHNPYDISLRIDAVEKFRHLPEAEALAAANKRVQNIIGKHEGSETAAVDPQLLERVQEQQLYKELQQLETEIPRLCQQQSYAEALTLLAGLRPSIDSFFDNVMVMDKNPDLQGNRINLLRLLHQLFIRIADISQLQSVAT
jgi:glycyl-tRNA synthetase beta chain